MEKEELTTEQEHYAAMEEFVCATENIRFVESRENWRAMTDFLNEHSLDMTPQNLRFAFLSLSNENKLDLMPLGQVAPPQPPQPEKPTPVAQPAPGPIKARKFAMYKNGNRITGSVRSL